MVCEIYSKTLFHKTILEKGKKGRKILKREKEGKGRKEEKDEKESYGWQKKRKCLAK